MAMSVAEVRGWLLTQPRAATVRVITGDDRQHEVAIKSGASWMAIAESILALDPILIEAYDAGGAILRAVRPLETPDAHESAPTRSRGAVAPLVLPPNTDPHAAMLIHFADLLAAAYRHSTDVAFERLASLFEAVNRRSESLEQSLEATHKLLRRAYADTIDNAPEPSKSGGDDLLNDVISNFAAAAAQNGGHNNPNSNGKAGS